MDKKDRFINMADEETIEIETDETVFSAEDMPPEYQEWLDLIRSMDELPAVS